MLLKILHISILWDIAKNLMRARFLVLNIHIKKQSQRNYLNIHIKTLGEKNEIPIKSNKKRPENRKNFIKVSRTKDSSLKRLIKLINYW